jgi:hypothetical protein
MCISWSRLGMGFAASRTTTKVYWLCKLGTVPDSQFGRAGSRRAELDGLAVHLDVYVLHVDSSSTTITSLFSAAVSLRTVVE